MSLHVARLTGRGIMIYLDYFLLETAQTLAMLHFLPHSLHGAGFSVSGGMQTVVSR